MPFEFAFIVVTIIATFRWRYFKELVTSIRLVIRCLLLHLKDLQTVITRLAFIVANYNLILHLEFITIRGE